MLDRPTRPALDWRIPRPSRSGASWGRPGFRRLAGALAVLAGAVLSAAPAAAAASAEDEGWNVLAFGDRASVNPRCPAQLAGVDGGSAGLTEVGEPTSTDATPSRWPGTRGVWTDGCVYTDIALQLDDTDGFTAFGSKSAEVWVIWSESEFDGVAGSCNTPVPNSASGTWEYLASGTHRVVARYSASPDMAGAARGLAAGLIAQVEDAAVLCPALDDPNGGDTSSATDTTAGARGTGTSFPTAGVIAIAAAAVAAGIGVIAAGVGAARRRGRRPAPVATASTALPPPPPRPPVPKPPRPAPTRTALPSPRQMPEAPREVDASDPCWWLVTRYRESMAKRQILQEQISQLQNQYRNYTEHIEANAEEEFWGACFDVAKLGLEVRHPSSAPTGKIDAVVSAYEKSFRDSVIKQALTAAAMGEPFDPAQVADKAVTDAIGFRAAEAGDPTQGVFGAYLKESMTALVTRVKASDALRNVKALVDSGVITSADAPYLEKVTEGPFKEDVAPAFDVIFKFIEFWKKNEAWAAGVERRDLLRKARNELFVGKLTELQNTLSYVLVEYKADVEQLARCRKDHGMP